MNYVTAGSKVEWLPHGRDFASADLAAMPEDGNRYELVDGASEPVMSRLVVRRIGRRSA